MEMPKSDDLEPSAENRSLYIYLVNLRMFSEEIVNGHELKTHLGF